MNPHQTNSHQKHQHQHQGGPQNQSHHTETSHAKPVSNPSGTTGVKTLTQDDDSPPDSSSKR